MTRPTVKAFFDRDTWTLTFVAYDKSTKDAIIIDPVWDYDPASSVLSSKSVEILADFIKKEGLRPRLVLETHAHADHITGAQVLKKHYPEIKVGIGSKITEVQKVFKEVFNLGSDFKTDGSQFDILIEEERSLAAGSLTVKTLFTPGHTPACATYIIGDAVFTGDALFMPDYGTGRCDFPAGSSDDLYQSIFNKIYKLPDEYRVFVGHDYLPNNRELAFESTIAEEKKKNIQLNQLTEKNQFVEKRNQRDKVLAAPRLLLPSVQLNINAGRLPQVESNQVGYLKIPLKVQA